VLKNSWTSLLAKKRKKEKRKKAIILKALGAWWLVRADHGR